MIDRRSSLTAIQAIYLVRIYILAYYIAALAHYSYSILINAPSLFLKPAMGPPTVPKRLDVFYTALSLNISQDLD